MKKKGFDIEATAELFEGLARVARLAVEGTPGQSPPSKDPLRLAPIGGLRLPPIPQNPTKYILKAPVTRKTKPVVAVPANKSVEDAAYVAPVQKAEIPISVRVSSLEYKVLLEVEQVIRLTLDVRKMLP